MSLQMTFDEGVAYAERLNKGHLDHMILCDSYPFLAYLNSSGMITTGRSKCWGRNLTDATNDSYQGFECGEDIKPPGKFKGIGTTKFCMNEHVVSLETCSQEEMYIPGDCAPLMDQLQEKIDVTNMSLSRRLECALLMDPLGVPKQSPGFFWFLNDKIGLPGRPHVIGAIDNRDNAWWQSQIKRPGQSWPSFDVYNKEKPWTYHAVDDVTTDPYDPLSTTPWQVFSIHGTLDPLIANLKRTCMRGVKGAIGWMSVDLYETLLVLAKAETSGLLLWTKQGDTLIGDAEYVSYRQMKFMVAECLPAGTILVTNPDDLKIRVHADAWLRATPWQEAERAQRKTMFINVWWGVDIMNPMGLALAVNVSHKSA